jgi:two-component system, cell cycle sensor histidine kinase and response regulator CckA
MEKKPGSKYKLEDLIDIIHFQELQGRLNEIYALPSSIIDNNGNILTATFWQDICSKFHWKSGECENACMASDKYIKAHLSEATPAVTCKCPHGLSYNVIPIIIDGIHYGNFITGQFFLEAPDMEIFRAQAIKYDFPVEPYLAAVKKVPVWTKIKLNSYLSFIRELIAIISESSLEKLKEIESRVQLQQSEEKYRQLFETMRDAYARIDTEGMITEANNAFLEMVGYSMDELGRYSFKDITHGKWHEREREILEKQVLTRGYSDIYEKEYIHKKGHIFPVELRTFLLRDTYGDPTGVWSIVRDISERKRVEESIAAQLRFMEDSAGLSVKDLLQKFLDEIEELTGSEIGFFHFLEDDQETLSLQTWSTNTLKKMCTAEGAGMHYSISKAGVWVECIRERKPVIHNDYKNLEHKKGYPDGHAPIIRELILPVIRRDKIVAILGVGNKKTGYTDEDIKTVQHFSDLAWETVVRRHAEESLRKSEQQHRTILQTAIDGFLLIDKNGEMIEVNDAYCKMSGYMREELLYKNTVILSADPPEDIKNEIGVIIDRKSHRFNRRHKRKDGTVFDVEISAQYLKEEDALVCFIRDITEKRRLEESLAVLLERLDLATEAAKLGIWDWDINNNSLIWDDAMYSLYGIEKEESEDIYKLWLNSIHNADRGKLDDILQKSSKEEGDYNTEFRIFRPDMTMKYIKTVGKVFKNSDGIPARMIGVSYDITKNKEMEIQLQQAQKMESIGTLAGGIAHDFNNILSPIMMHAEMGMDELPPDHPMQFSMKEIFRASQRARDLVKQILTFARKTPEKRTPLQSSLIIKEAVRFLRSTIPTTIHIQYEIKTENDVVLADPTQLNQIVMNLCSNAAYAMKEKGGVLEIILDQEEISPSQTNRPLNLKPGKYVKLTVRDTGTGIPPDIIERIFEPYFTTKKVGEGTGLGLATVHGIILNYGGDISVESYVGSGTAFRVYIPSVEKEVSLSDAETVPVIKKGSEHILFVDDEKAAVDVSIKALERYGYRVKGMTDSKSALEEFRKNPDIYKMLITDMTMPDMAGDELSEEILAIKPGLPVILCTGFSEKVNSDKINGETARKAGIRAIVMKPIIMKELLKIIREIFDKQK